MSKTSVWARRKARRALVQATYQWQVSASSLTQLREEFVGHAVLQKADTEFFDEVLSHVLRDSTSLDELIVPLLDRPLDQLDLVERAILRLATTEFSHRIDVPYRVVIDEYVELAKVFGAQDSHKYVNGVLDRLAAILRPVEVNAHTGVKRS